MSLALGTLPVTRLRITVPTVGAWLVDCDVDLASDQALPTGKQSITIGTATLQGTVIPAGTGRFGETVRVRLLGGGGGWANLLDPTHWHNDAGVSSTQVTTETANAVGETANDVAPIAYGPDFERVGDPRFGGQAMASSVLEARAWYVDANGITQIASWPALTMGADADVLSFDPEQRVALMTADEIVWPGTTIMDVRFGPMVVCETDQTFGEKGSSVTAYCASSLTDRFGSAIAAVANVNDPAFGRIYLYRISSQGGDGRVKLQAVTKASGIPDTLPISIMWGVPGVSATFALGGAGYGSVVAVYFLNADRTQPRVFSFDGTPPATLTIDAKMALLLGAGASDFVALASLVKAELVKIATTLGTAVAPSGGGDVTYGTPYTTPGDVAATKVKAK